MSVDKMGRIQRLVAVGQAKGVDWSPEAIDWVAAMSAEKAPPCMTDGPLGMLIPRGPLHFQRKGTLRRNAPFISWIADAVTGAAQE